MLRGGLGRPENVPASRRARRAMALALGSFSRGVLRAVLLLVLTLWSLLLLAWLILHWGILPHIDEWRPGIEKRASSALGMPVRIGRIEVRSSGWVPALEMRDVVLSDREGREALRLPRVAAAVSPQSLLAFRLRFAQLYVEGAQLLVRRDAQGRFHVGGLDMAGTPTSGADSAAADWFFQQGEFVIRGGLLRWVDDLRQAPPLTLSGTDLVIRNGLRQHDLRLDATPPPDWGERFSLRGRFTQPLLSRAGDWQRWSGTAYAELPGADVAQLRQHVALPFELNTGRGGVRAWLELKAGQWRSATADLQLADVSLRLAEGLEPLGFAALQGRISAQRDAGSLRLQAERLGFTTLDGGVWPAGRLALTLQQRQRLDQAAVSQEPVTGGELQAERLDLGLMAGIAERLPLPDAMRSALADLAPDGELNGFTGQWTGPLGQPLRYRIKGQGSGLTLASAAAPGAHEVGRPGVRGAALTLDANETGGQAQLRLNGGALELPGVFDDPQVPLQRFDGQLIWRVQPAAAGSGLPPQVELRVQQARFANADAEGELQARWLTGPGTGHGPGRRYPGRLELSGQLSQGQATQVARYLPLGLGPAAREYVGRAVLGGRLRDVQFKVAGDLGDFPFGPGKTGEFRIAGQVEGATLAYVPAHDTGGEPPWPPFTQLSGQLVFERRSMQIRDAQARLWGIELKGVNGAIADLEHQPALLIEGGGRGPLADALKFVAATPIDAWTQHALQAATASGAADLRLSLNVPLHDLDSTAVKGSVVLAGNDVRLRPDVPLLAGARARIDFTQRAFSVAGGSARALGGELSFEGGSNGDNPLRFTAQGTATAEGLRRATELGDVSRLAGAMSGQAPYRLQLVVQNAGPRVAGKAAAAAAPGNPVAAGAASPGAAGAAALSGGHVDVLVTSPLTGMALDLPAPLRKAAADTMPLRFQTAVLDPAASPLRDTLRLELGPLLAEYQRELGADAPRVLRGAVALGESLPPLPPAGGVVAQARLAQLDLDAWEAAARRLVGDTAALSAPAVATAAATATTTATTTAAPPAANATATATAAATGTAGSGAAVAAGSAAAPGSGLAGASAYLPTDLTLRTQELGFGARRLGPLSAAVQRRQEADGEVWRLALQGDQVQGKVEYRPPAAGAPAGRLQARLARLSLPDAPKAPAGTEPRSPEAPGSVPALDLVIDEFEWAGKKLGRLEVDAPRPGGDGREWRLARLSLATPESRLTAAGVWGANRRMSMDFKLDFGDGGALLERLGLGRTVRGAKGQLKGQVGWNGSPLSPDWARLGGSLQLAVDSGQFLKVEPGAARLLGVLSLQALPRRLTLDFRDLFDQGFSFDKVTGDVQLAGGVARTNNLRIRGVQAVVLMEGSADLQHETQDLRMVIVPELNAGTASLAYAAINPAVGLGTFLAQMFLRKPLMQAGTREFQVTGPWGEPVVNPVERRFDAPLPDLDGPAAALEPGNPPAMPLQR